jgi:hypothetical protein
MLKLVPFVAPTDAPKRVIFACVGQNRLTRLIVAVYAMAAGWYRPNGLPRNGRNVGPDASRGRGLGALGQGAAVGPTSANIGADALRRRAVAGCSWPVRAGQRDVGALTGNA